MGADNIEAETRFRTLPLDDTLLEFDAEEEAFLKLETGIHDTGELRKHIIEVQADAYKVSRCFYADRMKSTWDSNTVFHVVLADLPVSLHSVVLIHEA